MMLCKHVIIPMNTPWLGYQAVAFAFISKQHHV